MPTKRFFNLHHEKKKRITDAVIYEFSNNGIEETDISSIIKRAGIPRGSFYQYFNDKDDLIIYIVKKLKEDKKEYCRDIIKKGSNTGFLDYYYDLFIRVLEFSKKNPDYVSIGLNMISMKSGKIKQYINKNRQGLFKYYIKLINSDKERGLIRKDISSESVAYMVMNLTSDNMIKLVDERRQNKNKAKKVFEDVFKILKCGLTPY